MTNSKSQINLNFQAQMTETVLSEILNFGHWSLFGIWCLGFVASPDMRSFCYQFDNDITPEPLIARKADA